MREDVVAYFEEPFRRTPARKEQTGFMIDFVVTEIRTGYLLNTNQAT
jgi:hypothetical protein